MYDGAWVVPRLLHEQADCLGAAPALILPSGTLSYADLVERASRFAAGLAGLGVRRGDRVATIADGASEEYIAMWFGTAWSGAVEVPINPALKGDLLRHILAESEPTVLIVQDQYVDLVEALGLSHRPPKIVIGRGSSNAAPRDVGFDEVMSSSPAGLGVLAETDLLHIMYTSGTTGRSKGVVHTHRSALTNARAAVDLLAIDFSDSAYCYFPLFHVTGRMYGVLASLWTSGHVYLTDKFSVTSFWDDVKAAGTTWTMAVGGILQLLDARELSESDRAHGLRFICSGRVPPEIHARFERRFGLELLDIYGLTEAGTLTGQRLGEPKKIGSAGKSVPHFEVEIHDEQDERLDQGCVGEICVRPRRPYSMFSGYWRQPEATLEAFRNLWFHTGDAGVEEEDGTFRIVDRLKDSIRRLGENISAFEVESVVNEHPDIVESAAYPAMPGDGDEEVMVAVVMQPRRDMNSGDFFDFCMERLPGYAVPRFVRIVAELPKTHSQRVEKYRLREEGITPDTIDIRPSRRATMIESTPKADG